MDDNYTTLEHKSDSTSIHLYILILPVVCVVVGVAALGVASILIPNLFRKSTINFYVMFVCPLAKFMWLVWVTNSLG